MGYTSLPRVYRKLLRSSRRNGADCKKNEEWISVQVKNSFLYADEKRCQVNLPRLVRRVREDEECSSNIVGHTEDKQ